MPDRDSQRLIDLAAPLLLGTIRADARESTGGNHTSIDRVRTVLASALSSGASGGADAPTAMAMADRAIAQATAAVLSAREAKGAIELTWDQRSSLEAIVCVSGRPAMRYKNGEIQRPIGDDTANEKWITLLGFYREAINRCSASVGRVGLITAGGVLPIGTAWRASRDLVVTNKHVAAHLVANDAVPVANWRLGAMKPAVVEFGCSDDSVDRRTSQVADFVYCRESEIADLALLRIKGDNELPKPLPIEWSIDMLGRTIEQRFEGRSVYVVGHPYDETSAVATAIFVRADGFKRCAPGQVTSLSATGLRFEHDCSTLKGNSGSCVFTADTHAVVGLHVGGRGVDERTGLAKGNIALSMARLRDGQFADLVKS